MAILVYRSFRGVSFTRGVLQLSFWHNLIGKDMMISDRELLSRASRHLWLPMVDLNLLQVETINQGLGSRAGGGGGGGGGGDGGSIHLVAFGSTCEPPQSRLDI